jgi:hypothetical protein
MVELALPLVLLTLAADAPPNVPALLIGYSQMYDLQFGEAHKTFSEYTRENPGDPVAVASDAAAYLFQEFDRLQILRSEFFAHDDNFRSPAKLMPDPEIRKVFDARLVNARALASEALASDPQDRNALFAMILILGLKADFDGLIDKRYLSALTAMKDARTTADKLLMIDPSYHDAHLALGVENYVLSLKPAPLRWFLQIAGAGTDRQRGIERLRITADKGYYLKPYARLLLAVAALRDKDRERARDLLAELALQFPHNRLFVEELNRLR